MEVFLDAGARAYTMPIHIELVSSVMENGIDIARNLLVNK